MPAERIHDGRTIVSVVEEQRDDVTNRAYFEGDRWIEFRPASSKPRYILSNELKRLGQDDPEGKAEDIINEFVVARLVDWSLTDKDLTSLPDDDMTGDKLEITVDNFADVQRQLAAQIAFQVMGDRPWNRPKNHEGKYYRSLQELEKNSSAASG